MQDYQKLLLEMLGLKKIYINNIMWEGIFMRQFCMHYIRKTKSLDGLWDFKKEDGKAYLMPVPGCWEMHPEMLRYRGKGTYKKKILVENSGNVRLIFKGVSHTADVYFDGIKVKHHYNAFTPFDVIVSNVKKGEHEIKVDVNNSFGIESALHKGNDYYSYGGITRPAGFEIVPDIYIKNIHFTPEFDDGKWFGKIEAEIHNISNKSENVDVIFSLADKEKIINNVEVLPMGSKKVLWEEVFENIVPWTNENPKLYNITCKLSENGVIFDDLIERIGFRVVEIKGKDILLNGNKIFLKGFNRHEDYADMGCAIPVQMMMKDVWLMKDMGANAVRTCHYPNDERFLDICDEMGLMVWEENHARGLRLKDMQNPNFEKQCEDCVNEMIYNHYNHPSILIWGILNECASDTPEGREMYKKQFEQIKSLDVSRPHTFASCKHFNDICLDLPDIVSFNIYSGWYSDDPVKETFEKELDWIYNSGGDNKPFIMSEFGGAAMYGFRDPARRKWSEERQADILEETLDCYMNNENISGVFIWQFCDCRVTEEENWFQSRACMRNNKGVVDQYRRPKLSYEVVKKKFKNK